VKALLGGHPLTRRFREKAPLEFADVALPHAARRRAVRRRPSSPRACSTPIRSL
jgi:hypothetical protein